MKLPQSEVVTLRKETLATRIADGLRQEILRGVLAPAQKINLDQLRDRFGSSVTPLREAMSRLVAEGLVEAEDLRGYRVASVSAANLKEVTLLRAEMETLALRHAIERGDLEWEGAIAGALYKLGRTRYDPQAPEGLDAWERAHAEFHLALIRGCGMPLLLGFCAELHALNDRYRRIYLHSDGGDAQGACEHKTIAEAAMARNTDRASTLLRAHIEQTGTNLARALSERKAAK